MQSSRSSAYPWALLGLLTGFWGLVGLNRVGIAYLFPILNPLFHLQYWQTGLLVSGTSFTWAFSSWGSGWLADRYGRRKVLLPGGVIACAATAAMGGAWNFLSLFIVRDLVGIGDGVGWPNAQAAIAREFSERSRAFASAVFTSGYPVFGAVLGPGIIVGLATALGWRWVYPIIALVFFFVIVGLYFVMREPDSAADRHQTLDWRNAFGVLRYRSTIFLMLVQSGALGWLQVGTAFNTLYLVRIKHVPLPGTVPILTAFGVAGVVGALILPHLSNYIGRKTMIFGGGTLSGISLGLYALGGFPLLPATLLLCASGFFQGAIIPLAAATVVVESLPKPMHGSAMGAINFVGVMIGTFLLPILAGIFADRFGLAGAITLAAGCMFVAGLFVLGVPESAPRVLARRGVKPVEVVT
ncbi:MAG: MFS transporter [Candidatus Dormibacteraeota bacterium]|nr:MFS transporter [Candidatus Dormibacteraeota bacterium]